jgi:hypothetical protein
VLALTALVALAATRASAQRSLGAGFSLAAGPETSTDYAGLPGEHRPSIAYSLGSFELSAFVHEGLSIDVSAQLWATLVGLVRSQIAWTSTVYLDWSFGGSLRVLVGPGLGVSTLAAPSDPTGHAGAELRLAALLGMESLSEGEAFGFRLVTRPWLGLGGGDAGLQLGYGAMIEAAFLFYAP